MVHKGAKGCHTESPGTLLVQHLSWEQDTGPLTPEPSTCLKPTGVWCSCHGPAPPIQVPSEPEWPHTSLHCSAFITGGCFWLLTGINRDPQLATVHRVGFSEQSALKEMSFPNPSSQGWGIYVEEEVKSQRWWLTPRKLSPDTSGLIHM